MKARLLLRIAIHCILPLVIGFLIYYFFRPEVAFIQWMGNTLPLMNPQEMSAFGKWLVYSGPDFCWSYSLTSALLLWNNTRTHPHRFFPWIAAALVIGAELVQWSLPGKFVFDWADLLAAVLAFILSLIFIKHRP